MSGESLLPEDAPGSIYGPDGEPHFFQDPAMDRFVAVLLNLASEVWVQTERVDHLQQVLKRHGLDSAAVALDKDTDRARELALKAYIDRVLAPLREPGR